MPAQPAGKGVKGCPYKWQQYPVQLPLHPRRDHLALRGIHLQRPLVQASRYVPVPGKGELFDIFLAQGGLPLDRLALELQVRRLDGFHFLQPSISLLVASLARGQGFFEMRRRPCFRRGKGVEEAEAQCWPGVVSFIGRPTNRLLHSRKTSASSATVSGGGERV